MLGQIHTRSPRELACLSLHLSNSHIDGNRMTWFNYVVHYGVTKCYLSVDDNLVCLKITPVLSAVVGPEKVQGVCLNPPPVFKYPLKMK